MALLKLLLLSWLLIFTHSSNVQAREVLAIGTEFAGIFERNSTGDLVGFGVDIIRALAKQNGDSVKFEMYPWNRAQWMVENGFAQILIGPYKTAKREAKFAFAQRAFYRDFMTFYVRIGSTVYWDGDYTALHHLRVGAINGWVYGLQFEQMRSVFKPEQVNSLVNGLKMLNAKHIDLLASNVRNTDAVAKALGMSDTVKVLDPVIDTQDGYLAYCKKNQCDELRMQYDDTYEQLRESGQLLKMARKFNIRLP